MKKRSERRKRYALAVVRWNQKIFIPPQTPFTGPQDCQNLISWR